MHKSVTGSCLVAPLVFMTARVFAFSVALLGLTSSLAFAVDPPSNVNIDGADLSWDAVPGAFEYHIYRFDEPIPSNTNLGAYQGQTTGTFVPLDSFGYPFGFYTVVAVQFDERLMPVAFSAVTEGEIVGYIDPDDSSSLASSLISVINIRRCENVQAGGSCSVTCSPTGIPAGGACRANPGVVLHQKALRDGYQCIAQQDTSFVETDAVCLFLRQGD